MQVDEIRPELRKAITRVPRLPFHKPFWLPLTRRLFNAASKTRAEAGVQVQTRSEGGVSLRLITPSGGPRQRRALLWLHGGGYIAGRPDQLDAVASAFAKALGAVVVMPHYRLAPRHPFPAGLDDCHSAWHWLCGACAELGVDPARLAIVGNSAGGGLAAALVQRLHDEGGARPAAQVLFYPMLDDRTCVDDRLSQRNHFIWNNQANRVAWGQYLAPHAPGAATLPDYAAAARRNDTRGLPPAWLGLAGIDLFCDEGRAYANRLHQDGVPCDVQWVPGAPHVFEVLAPEAEVSRTFLASALAFLDKHLTEASDDAVDDTAEGA